MTFLVLLIFGAGGFGVISTTLLDPDTARLLNSVVNLVTLALVFWHGREVKQNVKPILEDTSEKVTHLDATLGRRDPEPPMIGHTRRRTDHPR